ncbi:UNVERIFIED_CONTAM: tc1a [Trichonephila clavipes]
MHRHTGPAPGIMVWDGIRFHCFTHLVRIAGTLNGQCHTLEVLEPGVLPYIQRLPLAISQQDNARPHVALNVQEFFFTHLIELLPPNRKRVVHARTTTDFGIHHLLLHQINFGNMWKPHGLLYPKVSSKASLILCRGRPQQTSRREAHHIVRNASVQPTASLAIIQARVAPSLEAPVSSRTIRRRLAEGHLGSQRPLRVQPLTPTHRCLRLEWCHARGSWTVCAAEWNQIVFSDKSRFNLSRDDNRVRVWRPGVIYYVLKTDYMLSFTFRDLYNLPRCVIKD